MTQCRCLVNLSLQVTHQIDLTPLTGVLQKFEGAKWLSGSGSNKIEWSSSLFTDPKLSSGIEWWSMIVACSRARIYPSDSSMFNTNLATSVLSLSYARELKSSSPLSYPNLTSPNCWYADTGARAWLARTVITYSAPKWERKSEKIQKKKKVPVEYLGIVVPWCGGASYWFSNS